MSDTGGHFVEVCGDGFVHGQCKCPGPKDVQRVTCPTLGVHESGWLVWDEMRQQVRRQGDVPPSRAEQAKLGYATTNDLLRELAARVDTRVELRGPVGDDLLRRLGDLKEAISKAGPDLLAYRTVDG